MITTQTKHSVTCSMTFGRPDKTGTCPRCNELSAGFGARKGWGYQKKQTELSRIREIHNHDCKKSGCGPVCTFGDW